MKKRLDVALVERGLAASRERAQALVLAGVVTLNGQRADRPAAPVAEADDLQVAAPPPYVSRGGHKLAHALDAFGLDPRDLVALDAGASTGGFTDVLLQRGARRVYAVDVGYGQLDYRLRQDPRVVVLERTNLRLLSALPEPVDLATLDLSFISLCLVLPAVGNLLALEGRVVALVKPQFEVGKGKVGKGGVVRDPALQVGAIEGVVACAKKLGLQFRGVTPSPIRGPAGNREFLLLLTRAGEPFPVAAIAAAVEREAPPPDQ